MSNETMNKLREFLDAAAGDGLMCAGHNADDLYVALFPKEYEAALEGTPAAARSNWCSRCGCGNDKAGYAHLDACPTLRAPAAVVADAKPVARLRYGTSKDMPTVLSWNSLPAGTYMVYVEPRTSSNPAPAANADWMAEAHRLVAKLADAHELPARSQGGILTWAKASNDLLAHLGKRP